MTAMQESDIAAVVQAVLRELGQWPATLDAASTPAPYAASTPGTAGAAGDAPEAPDTLPALCDLGSDPARQHCGVAQPRHPGVLQELQRSTRARVASGRCGPRPRTQALLRFLADHARSKDTVLSEVPAPWVQQSGLFEVSTDIEHKDQYLTRPDIGRVLGAQALQTLRERCQPQPDVQLVISDGLSTEATTSNFEDIVPPLLRGLQSLGLTVGTPFFVRYGRVKVQDQIGELLGAKVVILLIGERPGLGQSESLSCYMVYQPTRDTVEAQRTCISNIHRNGTPPVEAAAVIAELAARMVQEQASGIALAQKLAGTA